VMVNVKNSNGADIIDPEIFDCSDKQGTLTGIPPQDDCIIEVAGKNSDDEIIYWGEITEVDLIAGQNDVGPIEVESVDPQAPGDITADVLVGEWYVFEEYTDDWDMDIYLYSNGTFSATEYEYSPEFNTYYWSGTWSYDETSQYFWFMTDEGNIVDGYITATDADMFYLDGSWPDGTEAYFYWERW